MYGFSYKCRNGSCSFDEDVVTWAPKQHVHPGEWEWESVGFFLEMSVLTLKCPNGKPMEIMAEKNSIESFTII